MRPPNLFCGKAVAGLCAVSILLAGCGDSTKPTVANAKYGDLRIFLSKETDFYQPDELVGHVHRPQAVRRKRLKEHAQGRFKMKTNNLGFREDLATDPEKQPGTVRILVTGDSHTDGSVPNVESFSNVLEARLSARFGSACFEIINGGVGHYGPYNYPRFLEKYAFLEPDLYIVNFYVGNDFLDCCRLLTADSEQKRPDGYLPTLRRANKKLGSGVSQGLNQIYYFTSFPGMIDTALDFSEQQLLKTRDFCARHGIEFIVLLLPTRLDVETIAMAKARATAKEILGLSERQLGLNRELAARLRSRLEESGVECLDLEPMISGSGRGLYWNYDHHLSTRGHWQVAKLLEEVYRPRFAALAQEASGRTALPPSGGASY